MNIRDLEAMEEDEARADFDAVLAEFTRVVAVVHRDLKHAGLMEVERTPVLQEFARWYLRTCIEAGND